MNGKYLLLSALVAACAVGAEEVKLNKAADWTNLRDAVASDKGMTIKGSQIFFSAKSFDVDPAKTYELELEARNVGADPATIYAGFQVLNAEGKEVSSVAASPVIGTETELVKPIQKGDRQIVVKDAAKWPKAKWRNLALNVKKDLSDVPNLNSIPMDIVDIQKTEAGYVVSLDKPMKADVPAGTAVRVHAGGGYMYTAGWKKLEGNQFFKLEGKVKGVLPGPGYQRNIWPRGAVKARIVLLVNWGNAGATTELKDIELEIK